MDRAVPLLSMLSADADASNTAAATVTRRQTVIAKRFTDPSSLGDGHGEISQPAAAPGWIKVESSTEKWKPSRAWFLES
jgi:hypothetical protein